MNRKRRTEEEVVRASDHLCYEIWMLTSLAHGMASGIAGESVINNALLESFTIHARVLLDFFYSEKPQPDDVIAEDYFPTPEEWQKARPAKSQILAKVHKRVGKEVAHLTHARLEVTPELKGWPFIQIANDINAAFKEFFDIVPEHLLGPRWDKLKPAGVDRRRQLHPRSY